LEKLEKEPPYGSNEWWEYSIKKGEEDIKKGNYQVFDSGKSLANYLTLSLGPHDEGLGKK
jgi:hypothetical protein